MLASREVTILSDGDLTLHGLRAGDGVALEPLASEPDLVRYFPVAGELPGHGCTAQEWEQDAIGQWEKGAAANFVIELGTERVGWCVLHHLDWHFQQAMTAYWVAGNARGRGVAVRTLKLLCSYAFGDLRLERIGLQADADNHASRRVAERAGFSFEGVLRAFGTRDGAHGSERADHVLYSRLASDSR